MNLKFVNGYASWISLVCFFMVLQILTLLSLHTMQNVYLLKADQQNILELSILNHAQNMIQQNLRIRICQTNEKQIDNKEEIIQNVMVSFTDHKTYIECDYMDVCMKIYYDDKAIVSVDIDEH